MSEEKVSTRERKRTLTDSERKRNRSAVSSKWNKCRIYVGDQLDRSNELKEVLHVQTHAEVANILLDIIAAMSFPSCNNTNQENENNTCCLPECSNGTTNTTCDQQCPIGMSILSTNNYSAFCQQSTGIPNLTDFNKICVPTCPLNFVKVMINQIALCIECKDICVSTLAREYTYDVCSCDDEVTITPRDQSDQPEKIDNFFNHDYFILFLSGSIGVIIIVIVASLICTCRWRRSYQFAPNTHSQNQDTFTESTIIQYNSSQLSSLDYSGQQDNGNHYVDIQYNHENSSIQDISSQLPSTSGQHDNEIHYAECNHEEEMTQTGKPKLPKRKTAHEKCRSKEKINSTKKYDREDYDSVHFNSTTTNQTEPEKPDENGKVDSIIHIQSASDEGASANAYLPMIVQRQGKTETSENIKPVSNVYESMKGISEMANVSADHSSTSTNCNTNALSIPKSHDQSKKSHDTILTVKLGEDAYSSNAGVLLKKQMVARDITHKTRDDEGKVSDPCSLKDETDQEKSEKYSQAELVYENLYIGK